MGKESKAAIKKGSEKTWGEHYQNLGKDVYCKKDYIGNTNHLKGLLQAILDLGPKMVCETGIGTGHLSIWLAEHGIKATGIDTDPVIVENAKKFLESEFEELKVEFLIDDAFRHERDYDVIFHQGLVEHFDNVTITKLLQHQIKHCEWLVVSMPLKDYFKQVPEARFGNERELTEGQWRRIIEEANVGKLVRTFRYGVGQYALILEENLLKAKEVK